MAIEQPGKSTSSTAMILQTKYQQVWQEKYFLVFRWLQTTDQMTAEQYTQELKKAAEIIAKYKPANILLISKDFNYVIPINQFDEVNDILLPVYNSSGVKKLAVIEPENIIVTLSMSKTIDETRPYRNFQTRYFSTEKEARDWLSGK